jgi:uncharacterized DUF497 family protein
VEVKVEWDATKAASNLKKHGIAFVDAATALHDEFALTIDDDTCAEHRLVSLAIDALGRLLVIVYTLRHDNVRLISARRATKTEARQYAASRKP